MPTSAQFSVSPPECDDRKLAKYHARPRVTTGTCQSDSLCLDGVAAHGVAQLSYVGLNARSSERLNLRQKSDTDHNQYVCPQEETAALQPTTTSSVE